MLIKTGLYCWLAALVAGLSGAGWLCLIATAAGFACLGAAFCGSAQRLLR